MLRNTQRLFICITVITTLIAASLFFVTPALALQLNGITITITCTNFSNNAYTLVADRDNSTAAGSQEVFTLVATDGNSTIFSQTNTVPFTAPSTSYPAGAQTFNFTSTPDANPITVTVTSIAGNSLPAVQVLQQTFNCSTIDSDGDGVNDGADACPGTPVGTPVDATGCPLPPADSDGDGVPDATDACPGTPVGTPVDATGCPLDSDGDGVPNTIDNCPGTPVGTPVDATGCPLDSDGDGVNDGADACPGTPVGTPVDATGCPLPPADSDGDGVPDGTDACPGTPVGTPVDATGCPLPPGDSDGDGVPDGTDACPGTPVGTPVDATGCPLPPGDSDGDGVPDGTDACPGTPVGTPVDATGCPLPPADTDGDGVLDANDLCANTPVGSIVASNGCRDVDGDLSTENVDCDDADPAINPAATDIPGNGIDENCDGIDGTVPTTPPADDEDDGPPPGPPFIPGDDRVNVEAWASVAIFCRSYGIHIYAIDSESHGTLVLIVTPEEIAAVDALPSENTLIASAGDIQLWRLSTGEMQVNAPGQAPEPTKLYVFIWAGCSGFATTPAPSNTEAGGGGETAAVNSEQPVEVALAFQL